MRQALRRYLGERNAGPLAKEIDEGLARGLKGEKLEKYVEAAFRKAAERAGLPRKARRMISPAYIVARPSQPHN